MKSVLFLNVLYKPNIGGVENSIDELVKEYIKKKYCVEVFCSDKNNQSGIKLPLSEQGDCKITRYRYNGGVFSQLVAKDGVVQRMLKLRRNNSYSLVLSRSYYLTVIAFLLGFRCIKYIPPEVTYFLNRKNKHGGNKLKRYIKYFLQFLALFLSKRVFVFSELMVEQVSCFTFKLVAPVKVNPGIDFARYEVPSHKLRSSLRANYSIPSDAKVILALGRFSTIKQYDLAVLSMLHLDDSYLLIIVGAGPELESYKKLVLENQLTERVKFFPATYKAHEFYQLSDFFYMTSAYESFGQTVLEAISCGLKVVAFSSASGVSTNFESKINNRNLITYVEKQCPKELATAVKKEKTRFVDMEAINRLLKGYSWIELADRLESENV